MSVNADTPQVLCIARLRGVDLWTVDDGRLKGRHCSGPVPDELRELLAHYRPLIVEDLR
jgi:hypothetical protein